MRNINRAFRGSTNFPGEFQQMSSLNLNKFLFNAAGVLIGVVVVGYNVFDHFASEKPAAACGARYLKTTQLWLNSASGKMLTPIELQSRAGSGEWGVLNNEGLSRRRVRRRLWRWRSSWPSSDTTTSHMAVISPAFA